MKLGRLEYSKNGDNIMQECETRDSELDEELEDMSGLLTTVTYSENPHVQLQLSNFNCFFSGKQVLKNINFNILRSRVTALIGPSGCGKSTLIRSLNRMNDLIDTFTYTGQIFLLNQDIYAKKQDVTELRKRVGMVFQNRNPFPMSIYDNVIFGPYVCGIPRSRVGCTCGAGTRKPRTCGKK